jgi:hypothetical protein
MMNDISLFLGGLLLGVLITASLGFPAIGRAVAKIIAVILLGIGFGFLVWASVTRSQGGSLRPPFGSNLITEVGEAFGWGAGFFLGGIVALCLSFWSRSTNRDQLNDQRRDFSVHPEQSTSPQRPRD